MRRIIFTVKVFSANVVKGLEMPLNENELVLAWTALVPKTIYVNLNIREWCVRVIVQIRRKCVLPKLPYIVIPIQLVDSDGRETWMKVSAPGSGWLGLARGRVWRTAVGRLHGPASNYTPPGALCLNIQSCHLARSGYQTSDWCGDRSEMLSWLSRPERVRGCHGHAISLKYLFSFAVG